MQITANGISIEVLDEGPREGEPLLLIMGLGMQLIAWPEALVSDLVARGYRVIRFDNRDVGFSQTFNSQGVPNLPWNVLKFALRLPVTAPYGLDDMADDAAGVLKALGIARARVCGVSMGGMIAQLIAVRHPHMVSALHLIMTSSGARHLPKPTRAARMALLSRPGSASQEALVAHSVRLFQIIGSPGFPTPVDELTARVRRSLQRSSQPQGAARQLLAIAASGDRSGLLAQIRAPTRVVHGADDPLVPVACGRDLAGKIPGAQLEIIQGMGHDLPAQLLPTLAGLITKP